MNHNFAGTPIKTDPSMKPGEWRMEAGQITSNPPEPIPWWYHPRYWEKGEEARNEPDTPKLAEIVAEASIRAMQDIDGAIALLIKGNFCACDEAEPLDVEEEVYNQAIMDAREAIDKIKKHYGIS